jgi:hypothetical protein
MESAFNINVEEDRKKLRLVSKQFKKKGTKADPKFQKMIDEELGNYSLPKDEDTMHDQWELDFMLDSSEEDELVTELFREKTGDEMWEEYKDNEGVLVMTEGDRNGALAAVMQCLMEVQGMAEYFLLSKFKTDSAQPVSEMMRKLYSEVYRA